MIAVTAAVALKRGGSPSVELEEVAQALVTPKALALAAESSRSHQHALAVLGQLRQVTALGRSYRRIPVPPFHSVVVGVSLAADLLAADAVALVVAEGFAVVAMAGLVVAPDALEIVGFVAAVADFELVVAGLSGIESDESQAG